jgi:(p)ppGpp synthase/HD superfamily hydrolase
MSELVKAAKLFANSSHRRITANRLAAQQNFENHLKAVAQLVASVADDEHSIAAAWLHDVVEETSLRNTLAHSQDFVDEDWPQIVRLARRIENLLRQL